MSRTAVVLWALYLGGVMLLVVAMTLVTTYLTPVLDRARPPRAPVSPFELADKTGEVGIRHWAGHAYLLKAPAMSRMADDITDNRSPVMLCEDNRPLGPPHAPHDEIRDLGGGRFSHWGGYVLFSTSDGSDPRTNGRRYRLVQIGKC